MGQSPGRYAGATTDALTFLCAELRDEAQVRLGAVVFLLIEVVKRPLVGLQRDELLPVAAAAPLVHCAAPAGHLPIPRVGGLFHEAPREDQVVVDCNKCARRGLLFKCRE